MLTCHRTYNAITPRQWETYVVDQKHEQTIAIKCYNPCGAAGRSDLLNKITAKPEHDLVHSMQFCTDCYTIIITQ